MEATQTDDYFANMFIFLVFFLILLAYVSFKIKIKMIEIGTRKALEKQKRKDEKTKRLD